MPRVPRGRRPRRSRTRLAGQEVVCPDRAALQQAKRATLPKVLHQTWMDWGLIPGTLTCRLQALLANQGTGASSTMDAATTGPTRACVHAPVSTLTSHASHWRACLEKQKAKQLQVELEESTASGSSFRILCGDCRTAHYYNFIKRPDGSISYRADVLVLVHAHAHVTCTSVESPSRPTFCALRAHLRVVREEQQHLK